MHRKRQHPARGEQPEQAIKPANEAFLAEVGEQRPYPDQVKAKRLSLIVHRLELSRIGGGGKRTRSKMLLLERKRSREHVTRKESLRPMPLDQKPGEPSVPAAEVEHLRVFWPRTKQLADHLIEGLHKLKTLLEVGELSRIEVAIALQVGVLEHLIARMDLKRNTLPHRHTTGVGIPEQRVQLAAPLTQELFEPEREAIRRFSSPSTRLSTRTRMRARSSDQRFCASSSAFWGTGSG